jgi:hypothetical protein
VTSGAKTVITEGMRGSLTYGPKGRLASALAIILAFIGALQASNILTLLPPRYSNVGLIVTFVGLLVAGFSERIQGGASKPEVRAAAQSADDRNATAEANEEIDLDEINR